MAHITRNARDVLAVLLAVPAQAWRHAQQVADQLPGLTRNSARKILMGLETKQWAESYEEPAARMKARGGGGNPRRYYRLTELGRREAQAVLSRTPSRGPAAGEGAPAVVGAALAEQLGRLVREVWVASAELLDDPKPSWLKPWKELDEFQKVVDTRIGVALYQRGWAATNREVLSLSRELEAARAEARADRRAYGEAQTTIRVLHKEIDRLKAVVELLGGAPPDETRSGTM